MSDLADRHGRIADVVEPLEEMGVDASMEERTTDDDVLEVTLNLGLPAGLDPFDGGELAERIVALEAQCEQLRAARTGLQEDVDELAERLETVQSILLAVAEERDHCSERRDEFARRTTDLEERMTDLEERDASSRSDGTEHSDGAPGDEPGMAQGDLTDGEYETLEALRELGESSGSEDVAAAVDATLQSVRSWLPKLVQAGHVRTVPDPTDGRRKLYSPVEHDDPIDEGSEQQDDPPPASTDAAGGTESSTDAAGGIDSSTDAAGGIESSTDAAGGIDSSTDAAGGTESSTDAAGGTESSTDAAGGIESSTDAAGGIESSTDAAGAVHESNDLDGPTEEREDVAETDGDVDDESFDRSVDAGTQQGPEIGDDTAADSSDVDGTVYIASNGGSPSQVFHVRTDCSQLERATDFVEKDRAVVPNHRPCGTCVPDGLEEGLVAIAKGSSTTTYHRRADCSKLTSASNVAVQERETVPNYDPCKNCVHREDEASAREEADDHTPRAAQICDEHDLDGDAIVDALDAATAVYHVQRDLELSRDETQALLDDLGVLETFTGGGTLSRDRAEEVVRERDPRAN